MNFEIIIILLLLSQSAVNFQAAKGSCFQNCLLLIEVALENLKSSKRIGDAGGIVKKPMHLSLE
jgi:hypothetical protein